MAKDRLKNIWSRMKDRCYNKKHISFKYYGARGISVCEQWFKSLSTFKTWALANGYEDHLTLDRKDTNGNYEPGNCRWLTKKQQQSNRRDNVLREFDGKMLTTGQITEITGKSYMNEYQKTKRWIKKQQTI